MYDKKYEGYRTGTISSLNVNLKRDQIGASHSPGSMKEIRRDNVGNNSSFFQENIDS